MEALWVERAPRAIDEGRDAVLDRLRRVFVLARLHQPLRVLLSPLECESRRALEQPRGLELRVLRVDDLGRRVDPPKERLDRLELSLAH